MMMILGMFPFALQTTPYQTSNQSNTWRHVKNDRVGKSPRYQYIGPDEEPITLSGTLYPEISGGDVSLTTLETMAYTGRAWPLIEGTGKIYGMYVIDGLTQNRTEFLSRFWWGSRDQEARDGLRQHLLSVAKNETAPLAWDDAVKRFRALAEAYCSQQPRRPQGQGRP